MANHSGKSFFDALLNKLSPDSSWVMKKIAEHEGPRSKVQQWRRQWRELDQAIDVAIQKQQADWNVRRWLKDVRELAKVVDCTLDALASRASECKLVTGFASQCNIPGKKRPPSMKLECSCFSDLDATASNNIRTITDRLEGLNRERAELGLIIHSGNTRNSRRTFYR